MSGSAHVACEQRLKYGGGGTPLTSFDTHCTTPAPCRAAPAITAARRRGRAWSSSAAPSEWLRSGSAGPSLLGKRLQGQPCTLLAALARLQVQAGPLLLRALPEGRLAELTQTEVRQVCRVRIRGARPGHGRGHGCRRAALPPAGGRSRRARAGAGRVALWAAMKEPRVDLPFQLTREAFVASLPQVRLAQGGCVQRWKAHAWNVRRHAQRSLPLPPPACLSACLICS